MRLNNKNLILIRFQTFFFPVQSIKTTKQTNKDFSSALIGPNVFTIKLQQYVLYMCFCRYRGGGWRRRHAVAAPAWVLVVSTHVESHAAASFPQCQCAGGADETQHAVCTGLWGKLYTLKLNCFIPVPLIAPNRITNIILPNPPHVYHCLEIQVIPPLHWHSISWISLHSSTNLKKTYVFFTLNIKLK